jgi:hypothetical protein
MMGVADILKTIAEDKSLVLFNTVALSNSDSDILTRTLHLTRKQLYAVSPPCGSKKHLLKIYWLGHVYQDLVSITNHHV